MFKAVGPYKLQLGAGEVDGSRKRICKKHKQNYYPLQRGGISGLGVSECFHYFGNEESENKIGVSDIFILNKTTLFHPMSFAK